MPNLGWSGTASRDVRRVQSSRYEPPLGSLVSVDLVHSILDEELQLMKRAVDPGEDAKNVRSENSSKISQLGNSIL